MNTSSSPAS